MKIPHVKTDIDFELKSQKSKNILLLVVVLIVGFFVVYPFIVMKMSDSGLKTQPAIYQNIDKSIETKGFVIRNEVYVNNPHTGTVVPAVGNGSKVSAGNTVANIYASDSAAVNAERLKELSAEIGYYNEISGMLSGTALSDIDIYKNNVNDRLLALSGELEQNRYNQVYDKTRMLRAAIAKLKIATGEQINVSDKLISLNAEYDSLKNSASPKAGVTAPATGYYVSFSDGYENTFPYADVKNISCGQINEILESSPGAVPVGNVGKQITDFNWYLVCKTTAVELGNISAGDTVTVTFMDSAVDKLSMEVVGINQEEDGEELAIVLKSNEMNKDIAALRTEDIKIKVETFRGLRVDRMALRTVEGQPGVYIKSGNIIKFKKIFIVYSGDNFILSEKPKDVKDNGYLEQYDDIISEGTDLYDNKIIS